MNFTISDSTIEHYVLLIHGTWGVRDPDKNGGAQYTCTVPKDKKAKEKWQPYWWQRTNETGRTFADRLAKDLENTELSGAVWRDIDIGKEFSWWPCGNEHQDRLNAGKKLADYISQISKKKPNAKIHLIAHSHGGNVVLKALSEYLEESIREVDYTHSLQKQLKRIPGYQLKFLQKYNLAITTNKLQSGVDKAEQQLKQRLAINIGKIIFLGTPFFSKEWHDESITIRDWFDRLLSFVLMGAGGYLLYGYIFAIWLWLISWLPFVPSVGWVFWHWPWGMHVFPLVIGLTLATVFIATKPRWNTNLYWSLKKWNHKNKLKALVVQSIYLDEAFLAVSSEKLLNFFLPSAVEKIFPKPTWAFQVNRLTGEEENTVPAKFRILRNWVLQQCLNLLMFPIKLFTLLLRIPLKFALRRFIQTTIFGLPSDEFKHASIKASQGFKIINAFDASIIDATSLLIKNRSKQTAIDQSERYDFLFESCFPEERWKKSFIRDMLNKQGYTDEILKKISCGNLVELAKLVLAFEERKNEITGLVPLNHSQYYDSDEIRKKIVNFLIHS